MESIRFQVAFLNAVWLLLVFMKSMKTKVLTLIGCLPLWALAADLPELAIPQGVGVNIHFNRGHEQDLDLIAAAGFKFIRMDLGWAGIERKSGQYDWSAYDELLANLDKRGLRALLILDYSNPLYEESVTSRDPVSGQDRRDTASPQHPDSVAAFARWAAAAAEHFRGRRVVWEIWNEPNISFWKPRPDVKQYLSLALATCQAIRKVDPQATIIAPATSEFPWTFLEALFQGGLLEHLDAASVHPYRNPKKSPETAAEDYLKLRKLIERYAPDTKKQLPIISGEWGYSSNTKGVSPETQAAFLVRQQLANLLHGIPLSIWYDWKNDGADPNENEHNFGTVWPDLKPKPAYSALQVFTKQLQGYRLDRRLPELPPEDYVLLLKNAAGDQKIAAWTTGQPHAIDLPVAVSSTQDATVVDGLGQEQQLQVEAEKPRLQLTALPQYLSLKRR
jgi:polysaccharide biosynthesis protein PslG